MELGFDVRRQTGHVRRHAFSRKIRHADTAAAWLPTTLTIANFSAGANQTFTDAARRVQYGSVRTSSRDSASALTPT